MSIDTGSTAGNYDVIQRQSGACILRVVRLRGFTSAELSFADQTVEAEANLLAQVDVLKSYVRAMADRVNRYGVLGEFGLDAVMAALGEVDYDAVPSAIEPILLRTKKYFAQVYLPHSGSGYEDIIDDGCFIAAFRFDGAPTLDLYAIAAFVTLPEPVLVFYQVLRDGEMDPYFEKLRENPQVYETVMRNVWGVVEA